MVLTVYEQVAVYAAYQRTGSLRKAAHILGYSPNTIKTYVQQEGLSVQEQFRANKLLSKDKRLIGLYVGLWMGDGTQYIDGSSYTVKFCCHVSQTHLAELIRKMIKKLFGVTSWVSKEKDHNRLYVVLKSKFVYEWIQQYAVFNPKRKTYTVRLRTERFEEAFFEGCLLGLVLSDGYLKKTFSFNVISKNLAQQVFDMLVELGLSPRMYVHDRAKWGWNDLHMVYLRVSETKKLEKFLDSVVNKLGEESFQSLKY